MNARRIFDREGHAHFLTYSCYRRRRLLDHDEPKRVVLEVLVCLLARREGRCIGFVIMPDHVHALVWFPRDNQIVDFLKQWKRITSIKIKKCLRSRLVEYARQVDIREPVWQAGYYDFNIYSEHMMQKKIDYMHLNPVRAGLVSKAVDWPWSSAGYYENGTSVGLAVGWPE